MDKIKEYTQTSMGCKLLCQEAIKWDSYYCGLFGLISLVLNSQLQQIMSFNRYIFVGTGVAVIGWASLLYYQYKNSQNILPFTKFVAYANCGASLGVMGLAAFDMTIYGRILAVLVGLEVGAFGVVQHYFLDKEKKNRQQS